MIWRAILEGVTLAVLWALADYYLGPMLFGHGVYGHEYYCAAGVACAFGFFRGAMSK